MSEMTAREFVDQITVPTIRDFRDHPNSRRHAHLACIVTLHVGDHLAAAKEHDIISRVSVSSSGAFDLVQAVGNATKHRGPARKDRFKFRAGADFARPPAIMGRLACGLSRLGDTRGGRNIATGVPGGTDIYEAITRTLRAYVAEAPALLGGCDMSDL